MEPSNTSNDDLNPIGDSTSSKTPPSSGKFFQKKILLGVLLFFFITTAITLVFVRQQRQIADIRNQAAYPGCTCASENATSCGSQVFTIDNTCPSGHSCCPTATTCNATSSVATCQSVVVGGNCTVPAGPGKCTVTGPENSCLCLVGPTSIVTMTPTPTPRPVCNSTQSATSCSGIAVGNPCIGGSANGICTLMAAGDPNTCFCLVSSQCSQAMGCTNIGNPSGSTACCSGVAPFGDSSCTSGFRCNGSLCKQDCTIQRDPANPGYGQDFCNNLPDCSCVNRGTITGSCTSVTGGNATCLGKSVDASCTISGPGGSFGGLCKPDGGGAGPNYRCICERSCGNGPAATNTPTRTPTPIPPTNPPPTNPPPTSPPGATNTPTRTPTQTPTRTPTPSVTNTPTATPVIGQCLNIKIYKNNIIVPNPNSLMAGDNIIIAVVGTNATQARLKINNESTWRVSTTTNTAGEWTFTYQIPASGITSFSITAELFIGGVWQ